MKTKIVRIGNSKGVRIPKPLLQEAGFDEDVRLRLVEDGILIEGMTTPRAGWAAAAAAAQERGDDGLLDEATTTDFDEAEWVW